MKTIEIHNDENGDCIEILDSEKNTLAICGNVGFSIHDKLYLDESTGMSRYIKRIGRDARELARGIISEGEEFEIYYGDSVAGSNGAITLTLKDL